MRRLKTRNLFDAADAAGTAFLMGMDPTDPSAIRRAQKANSRDNVDFLRKGTTTRAGDGTRRFVASSGAEDVRANVASDASDPADVAEMRDAVRALFLSGRLTPAQRKTIHELATGGSIDDVARAVGCTVGSSTPYVHARNARAVAARFLLTN